MENLIDLYDLKHCSYVVLDQRLSLDGAGLQTQGKLMIWWLKYWNEILRNVGISEPIDPMEFLSQHKITALLFRDKIVSMHLLSLFSSKDFDTHPYFAKFDPSFKKAVQDLGAERILTLQYLALNPAFKKGKPFIYFPMTLGSLSVLHHKLENAQATISVARKDLGVSNAMSKMNFNPFLKDGRFNNTPVSYQLSLEPKPYPSEAVEELTNYFWKNKLEINFTNSDKEVA